MSNVSWSVQTPSSLKALDPDEPKLRVQLTGDTPQEIAEAYAALREMMGWTE